MKLIATFISNAALFLIDKDKKDVISLLKKTFPHDYVEAKADLFCCLTQMHPSLFHSKSVHLLHSVCEVIVSDSNRVGLPEAAF
jgi:hypothetical protein